MEKCQFKDCTNEATYGITKREFCIKHRTVDMYNLKNKRCQFVGCIKYASFGINRPQFCAKHKKPEMINQKNLCRYLGCKNKATYGNALYKVCIDHIQKGMHILKKKKGYSCTYSTKRKMIKKFFFFYLFS